MRGFERPCTRTLLGALASASLLAGCTGPQSALDPAGPAAASIHRLGLFMFGGAALVTLLVLALMLIPFRRGREGGSSRSVGQLFVWGGGVALPSITLTALLPFVFMTGTSMREAVAPEGHRVTVTARQFWWGFEHARPGGLSSVPTANELRLPVGEPVELTLLSPDVIHSFWVPSLAGKTDMIPGRTNRMTIQADRPGIYRGQCAEYCGLQHAQMAFHVIAMPRPEFDAWLAGMAAPARMPEDPFRREGRELFVAVGCAACHAVRGLSDAAAGPDLTNVGARQSIGAGRLPGGVGNLAAWIASTQHLKPGVAMPSYDHLSGVQLRAIAAYLEGLR